jgi:hypothetical protein
MKTRSQWFSQPLVFTLALCSAVTGSPAQEGFLTEEVPYISPTSQGNYQFRQVLSIGDKVPLTGSTTGKFQFLGYPEGLGGYKTTLAGKPVIKLLIGNRPGPERTNIFPAIVGATPFRGSYVSEFTISTDGSVLSGAPAYDTLWNENTYLGPIPKTDNTTPALGPIVDLKLGAAENGFDRTIAIVSAGGGPYGPTPSTIAIFDRQAYFLPKLGSFPKSGHAIQARTDNLSVIFALFEGGLGYDGSTSQLFMFVGTKDTRPYRSGLRKNGLDNGRLFVLESGSVGTVYPERRPLNCRWVAVPDELVPNSVPSVRDAPGHSVVVFDGITGGAFDKTNPNRFYFITKGQGDADGEHPPPFGRLFEITLGADPRQDCVLKRIYDFESIVNTGRDLVITPNYIESSRDYLFVSDTRPSATPNVGTVRANSIWSFKISDGFSALREGQFDRQAFPSIAPIDHLGWHLEGLLDASSLLNRPDSFFAIAQVALNFFTEPLPVRDGQLLLMFKTDL